MSSFGQLAQNYDGFIVDLWGVVHDGVKPYPGVLDCLSRLRDAGKTVVFLSNAPRRPHAIAATLGAMGISPHLYTGIMSSGEAVYLGLRDRTDEFATLGTKLYHLGPDRDRGVFDTLNFEQVDDPAAADFLLNTGPDDILGPQDPDLYAPVLKAALQAGIPMVCANPDLEVVRDGVRIICAGLLAEYYKADGGTSRERTLAIGDSLRTDIAGAKAAGIASCWVLSGIHALHPEAAPEEAAQMDLMPVSILPSFIW